MGGDHHGHHEQTFKIPDYRIYKVENCPELLKVQKALAVQGLKDPWLRNECWRHDAEVWGDFSAKARWKLLSFRGFKLGLILAVITAAAEHGYRYMGSSHGHGHGDHH